MTAISRKRREIEKQDNYEKSREFHEEYFGRTINVIGLSGKEILIMFVLCVKLITQIKNENSALMMV